MLQSDGDEECELEVSEVEAATVEALFATGAVRELVALIAEKGKS
jgi:hypothetical protein